MAGMFSKRGASLGAVVLSGGGAVSRIMDGALQRGVQMTYLVIHLWEVLIRRDTCPD